MNSQNNALFLWHSDAKNHGHNCLSTHRKFKYYHITCLRLRCSAIKVLYCSTAPSIVWCCMRFTICDLPKHTVSSAPSQVPSSWQVLLSVPSIWNASSHVNVHVSPGLSFPGEQLISPLSGEESLGHVVTNAIIENQYYCVHKRNI